MKVCPKCRRTWPDMGRFCPMDGSTLDPEPVPPPPPVRIQPVEDVREAPTDRVPAAPTPSRANVRHVDLRAEKPPARVPEPPPAPKGATTTSKQPAARKAPRKKADTFSETGWFVAGAKVSEDELAAVELPPEQLDAKYRATKALPEEVRKKYSLRYGTPEDDEPKRK